MKIRITDAIVPVDRTYKWSGEASFVIVASRDGETKLNLITILCKKRRLKMHQVRSLTKELREIADDLDTHGREQDPRYDELIEADETTNRIYET